MVTVGLYVRLEAKPGQEKEVENFLRDGLALVQEEPATTAWFAIRMGPTTFGIFDVFPEETGRQAHLSGKVAAALQARASELFTQPPRIEKLDVLAAKLPRPRKTVRKNESPCRLVRSFVYGTAAKLSLIIRSSNWPRTPEQRMLHSPTASIEDRANTFYGCSIR